jgi:hypothetical protein
MFSSTKRRMSVLERSIDISMAADRFEARVEEVVPLTGASTDEAFRSLMAPLKDHELEHLIEEFLEQIFGDDIAAREEFKRNAIKENEGVRIAQGQIGSDLPESFFEHRIATDNCSYRAVVLLGSLRAAILVRRRMAAPATGARTYLGARLKQ